MLTIKLENTIKNKKGEEVKEIVIDCSKITGRMMVDAQDCIMNLQYQLILASKISGIATSVLYETLNANQLYQIASEIKFFMMLGEQEAQEKKENIKSIIESTK